MTERNSGEDPRLIPGVFLALSLLVGIGYAVLLPPLQVPDEWGHFFRAYSVSEGYCLAHPELGVPDRIRTLHELYPPRVEILRRITASELMGFVRASPQEGTRVASSHAAVDLYSCVPYLPAAVSIAAGRSMSMSGLGLFYLGLLTNLMVYVCIVTFALRAMPDLRLLLFCVAMMPMTLQQAASLSADSLTLATSFLLCAYILRLAYGPEPRVRLRDQCVLAGIVAVVSLCKFNIWLVLLILLIPTRKFGGARARWTAVAAQVVVSCASVILWSQLNRANVQAYDALSALRGVHLAGNLKFVFQQPLLFTEALGRTLISKGAWYAQMFVGDLGWLCVPLPYWLVWSYIGLLFAIALTQSRIRMSTSQKALLGIMVACGVLSLFVLLWTLEEVDGNIGNIAAGKGTLPDIQGRYLIAFAVPFFLLFSNSKFRAGFRSMAFVAVAGVLVSNAVALRMIEWTYFESPHRQLAASDASRRYEGRIIKRPGGTPEDDKVYIVRDGAKHWVRDYRWFIDNGYKWPGDLTLISREECDAIPLGDPIQ